MGHSLAHFVYRNRIDNSELGEGAIPLYALSRSSRQNGFRLFAIALAAGTLAACAQPSGVARMSDLQSSGDEGPKNGAPSTQSIAGVAAKIDKDSLVGQKSRDTRQHFSSYGLASFYRDDGQTASGEAFDPHKMTAAHRTLPFGTRLLVTDVASGRSVTVRVNDRGPYVAGRVLDVSYSAAEKLGIVKRGISQVRFAILQ
jgi:rare lipoprotein A